MGVRHLVENCRQVVRFMWIGRSVSNKRERKKFIRISRLMNGGRALDERPRCFYLFLVYIVVLVQYVDHKQHNFCPLVFLRMHAIVVWCVCSTFRHIIIMNYHVNAALFGARASNVQVLACVFTVHRE